MAGAFKKPKSNVYRSFLYLNGDEVLNSLAGLEGGGIDEVLIRKTEEGGGELGAEAGISGAKIRGGKKKQRAFEEEVKRKRTEHSAATILLRRLHEEDAVGVLEGSYGKDVYEELEEHMLIEFQAEIRIHPLHQVVAAGRAWIEVAAGYGVGQAEIKEVREVIKVLEMLSQTKGKNQTFVVFAESGPESKDYKLVVPVHEKHLLVPLDEFSGRATFLAQVDRILREDEEDMAIRLIRNAPQLELEREGLVEAVPGLISGIDDLGIKTDEADFVLKKPAVILKPICIFK
jgi:hypothetical protein